MKGLLIFTPNIPINSGSVGWAPKNTLTPKFDVPVVLHLPGAPPGQPELLGNLPIELVTPHGPGIALGNDNLAIPVKSRIGRQPMLVIAHVGPDLRHVTALRLKLRLTLRAAIAFDQHHLVTVALLHQLEDNQQTLREFLVQLVPVA